MKIKSGFLLHTVGNEHVVVAVGERTAAFHGMIRLNASGVFLWERLQSDTTEDALVAALCEHYDVSAETAREAVRTFAAQLAAADVLEA